MTPQQKRILFVIGLTCTAFGALLGFMLGTAAMKPYACLEQNILALQGEIGRAR